MARQRSPSPTDQPPRESLGDRLERNIEQRMDVEGEIARGEQQAESGGRSLRGNLFWLGVTGLSLYLVAPSLIDVLGSADELDSIDWLWFPAMFMLQLCSLACLWVLQRMVLRDAKWPDVITSQLAGNALSKIAPAGGAVGGALQYRMLVDAGQERGRAVAGITAVNLLTFAVVLALPVLALPTFVRGSVERELIEATVIGVGVFGVLLAAGIALLAHDEPIRWVGRAVQSVRNRIRRRCDPLTTLPQRLTRERDKLLATLGPRWKQALLATVGRWAFDYASLLAALAAVGATPSPALVLLAFCAAQVLAQVPVTPGGLGFVEAGLTATLTLAGVAPGRAVLATLAYRLFSYWLQVPVGLVGFALHKRRLATAGGPPAS